MHLDEDQTALLKTWIIKKLEDISDADSDVLADYVLALVRTDEPEAVARTVSIDSLRDFLQENTDKFVDDLFGVLRSESYNPAALTAKVKRNRQEMEEDVDRARNQDTYYDSSINSRSLKRMRGTRVPGSDVYSTATKYTNAHAFPPSPALFPPLDPNDPMAAFLAMQAIMAMSPGFPNVEQQFPSRVAQIGKTGKRCRDYDKKGFCARGASCPYNHGDNPFLMPGMPQYDPRTAAMSLDRPPRRAKKSRMHSQRRSSTNSELRSHKENDDMSDTTLLVRNIPEQNYTDNEIRNFFSQYGEVVNVQIRQSAASANVEFADHDAAQRAFDSPKAIFDNRFVQVLWRRKREKADSGKHLSETHTIAELDTINIVEFSKQQEAAQRKFEETKAQREEMNRRRNELNTQIQAADEERERLSRELKKMEVADGITIVGNDKDTDLLKEQLAKLEAEAISLGLDPQKIDSSFEGYSQSNRGRGAFTGRFRGRGRGFRAGRGGGWHNSQGAVKRLDNRPRTLSIFFQDGNYDTHEEALRQYLLFGGGESALLKRDPARTDVALLEFPMRYQAENFMVAAGRSSIAHVGPVTFSWHRGEDGPASETRDADGVAVSHSAGTVASNDDHNYTDGDAEADNDAAYDVDADDDRWG